MKSDFLIMDPRHISSDNWDRAQEILSTFFNRDDCDWPDLIAMMAEALQSVQDEKDRKDFNVLDAEYDEITVSGIKPTPF